MAWKEQSSSKFLAHALIPTEAQLTRWPLSAAFITLTQRQAFYGHNQVLSTLKSWLFSECRLSISISFRTRGKEIALWQVDRKWGAGGGRLKTRENLYSKSMYVTLQRCLNIPTVNSLLRFHRPMEGRVAEDLRDLGIQFCALT